MTALVLVEFAEDIPVAIRRRRADPEQVRLIALTPEAAELLEAQAQPYAVPFEPDDIPVLNKLAMENLSRTLALSEWVSARLSALKPELNAIGLSPYVVIFMRSSRYSMLMPSVFTLCGSS